MESHHFSPFPDARLVEKAKAELPAGLAEKIPHPDTDPREREKRAQKIKLLNAPMTTLDDDDYGNIDSDDGVEFNYDDDFGDDDFVDDGSDQMSAEETNDGDREDQDD